MPHDLREQIRDHAQPRPRLHGFGEVDIGVAPALAHGLELTIASGCSSLADATCWRVEHVAARQWRAQHAECLASMPLADFDPTLFDLIY